MVVVLLLFPYKTSAEQSKTLEEIWVIADDTSVSETHVTTVLKQAQPDIGNIVNQANLLPGVNVSLGDSYGLDSWSTTINIRGYQSSIGEQQIGTTIDGLPNGDSVYGGGTRAYRFIDPANSGGIEVLQGTSKLSAPSLEALGGSLNFITSDPGPTSNLTLSVTRGESQAERIYLRYDTGPLLDGATSAWLSYSKQSATDWVNASASNKREHMAAKFVANIEGLDVTGLVIYDNAHEDNYQRVTLSEFESNPLQDRLTDEWVGIAWIDQTYRRAWSTLREHSYGYLKLKPNSALNIAKEIHLSWQVSIYGHNLTGRGDWVPPFLADVVDDSTQGHSEYLSNHTHFGGPLLGRIFFTDAQGRSLNPDPACASSLTHPYGGAGPALDPACYPSTAIPVQSYRHDHYKKQRSGGVAQLGLDFDWAGAAHLFQAGIWIEDMRRRDIRDWHKIVDANLGPQYQPEPYWVQYNQQYTRDTYNVFLSNTASWERTEIFLGAKNFLIKASELQTLAGTPSEHITNKTGWLYGAGIVYTPNTKGMEIFASYWENAKPLTDISLEFSSQPLPPGLEAESSITKEIGVRLRGNEYFLSGVLFHNTFKNSLEYFGPQLAGQIPNYSISQDGRFDNVGGLAMQGFELTSQWQWRNGMALYANYSFLDTEYLGSGLGETADQALGIEAGNEVVAAPREMYGLSATWSWRFGSLGITQKYVSDRYIDRANSQVAAGYHRSDAFVQLDFNQPNNRVQSLQAKLVVNNLFNEQHLGGINGFGAWIAPPRTATLSLTARL